MSRALPSLLSFGNLLVGTAAAALYLLGGSLLPLVLIVLAGVLDVLDGWTARRIGVSGGRRGKWMDSAADMVSFGIAPAVMIAATVPDPRAGWLLAAMHACAMAFRLVRFSRAQVPRDRWFLGMPSPAVAIAVTAALVAWRQDPQVTLFVLPVVLIFGLLAVGRLPYPKGNHPSLNLLPRWLTLVIYAAAAVLFFFRPGFALLGLMAVYAVLGPLLLRSYWMEKPPPPTPAAGSDDR